METPGKQGETPSPLRCKAAAETCEMSPPLDIESPDVAKTKRLESIPTKLCPALSR
jgi:hypothetical protein